MCSEHARVQISIRIYFAGAPKLQIFVLLFSVSTVVLVQIHIKKNTYSYCNTIHNNSIGIWGGEFDFPRALIRDRLQVFSLHHEYIIIISTPTEWNQYNNMT